MNKRIELEGMRFGRLLVGAQVESIGMATAYACKCDCGVEKVVRGISLRKGDTTSCGCGRTERMAKQKTSHGMYGTPTYRSWRAMIARCTDTKHKQYKDYGGRGIKIHPSGLKFENFFSSVGKRPEGKTLDRIDNDGNYEPGNCQWATRQEQNTNKRPTLRAKK